MLVLSRKKNEKIHIGSDITITIVRLKGHSTVQIGIEAPADVSIARGELIQAVKAAENSESSLGQALPVSRSTGQQAKQGADRGSAGTDPQSGDQEPGDDPTTGRPRGTGWAIRRHESSRDTTPRAAGGHVERPARRRCEVVRG